MEIDYTAIAFTNNTLDAGAIADNDNYGPAARVHSDAMSNTNNDNNEYIFFIRPFSRSHSHHHRQDARTQMGSE